MPRPTSCLQRNTTCHPHNGSEMRGTDLSRLSPTRRTRSWQCKGTRSQCRALSSTEVFVNTHMTMTTQNYLSHTYMCVNSVSIWVWTGRRYAIRGRTAGQPWTQTSRTGTTALLSHLKTKRELLINFTPKYCINILSTGESLKT